eukprot:SAG11_NODE_2711_length_3056_cov_1.984782_4_plen_91_part_00
MVLRRPSILEVCINICRQQKRAYFSAVLSWILRWEKGLTVSRLLVGCKKFGLVDGGQAVTLRRLLPGDLGDVVPIVLVFDVDEGFFFRHL